MTRKVYVFDTKQEKVVEKHKRTDVPVERGPMIISDIEPYQNVVDGQIIGGRKQHREFLKQYDLVEVGNERLPEREAYAPAPGEIESAIKRAIAEHR